MALKTDAMIVAGIAVALLVAGYYLKKKVGDAAVAAQEAAQHAWDLAENGGIPAVVPIAVEVVGDTLGIPRTNETECARAKREGRTLDASFACPAGDFLSYLWN